LQVIIEPYSEEDEIMVFHAHVQNGTIVMEGIDALPDGTELEIRVVSSNPPQKAEGPVRPWLKHIGCIKDMPPDASQRIDEVLYGRPDE
jgi:hypothetical protein